MRLVFAGTPEVAVTALRALVASRHTVEAVVTRPDAPAGRGRRLEPSPVAALAAELGIEVLKPDRPRDPSFLDRLREIAPDCCPVAAYGALLPQSALDIPRPRLGEPALLGAARLARRGAGAARDPAWRRHHRRDHLPDRRRSSTPARCTACSPSRSARPTPAATCWTGSPVAGADLLVETLDGIEDGTVLRRAAAGRRHQPRAEAHPRRRPSRLEAPRAPDRPPDPRLHPGPRRLDGVRGHAGSSSGR